ncbi:Uncharacterised protein [Vibrio cholerae]|nr:Uncharacterised protein [Vibrio cholerae]
MFFRCDIAEHGAAKPTNHGRTDTGGNVIITRGNIGS